MLVIGKGAAYSQADGALRALVDSSGIPFLATAMGRGVVPDSHTLNVNPARSAALAAADVVVIFGARCGAGPDDRTRAAGHRAVERFKCRRWICSGCSRLLCSGLRSLVLRPGCSTAAFNGQRTLTKVANYSPVLQCSMVLVDCFVSADTLWCGWCRRDSGIFIYDQVGALL